MLYFMAGPDAEAYGMTGVLTAVAHRKGTTGLKSDRRTGVSGRNQRFDASMAVAIGPSMGRIRTRGAMAASRHPNPSRGHTR